MRSNKGIWFRKGLRDGIPIALGYFTVAFTLGIAAKNAGMTPFQTMLSSMALHASAGQYAAYMLIAAGASYLECAIMELVANSRYLLMSCALSQKLSPDTPLWQRMILGYYVTDELFGISIAVPEKLEPCYTFGAILVASPGWFIGAYLGCLLGNILSASIVSALSVGLYGMFIAIIIPPAKKSGLIAALVLISMAASLLFTRLRVFDCISTGVKTIILTVVIAGAAAVLFPVKEDGDAA